jgi:V-type H+-transporting ATPase subunit a
MSCGIGMKALNAKYFKEPLDFWFDFLPQIVFMLALFGYMIGTIILKWLTDYTLKTSVAPSIINMLINMFLKMGSTVIFIIIYYYNAIDIL